MIDFENMLWGIDVDHFTILFERYFSQNDFKMNAFFDGYGAHILQQKSIHIRIACIKMAIADISWGTQNDAPRIEKYGRNLLKSILE